MKFYRLQIPVYILFTLFLNIFVLEAKAPRIIKSQDKVFIDLCNLLEEKLAKDIEILVYDPDIFTASPLLQRNLTNQFKLLLEVQNLIRSYNTVMIENALEENKNIQLEDIEEADHKELIDVASVLNIESVLMTSITVFDDEKRKVWDKKEKKWIEKKTALLQGNVFSTTDGSIMIRFSFYFLIEKE